MEWHKKSRRGNRLSAPHSAQLVLAVITAAISISCIILAFLDDFGHSAPGTDVYATVLATTILVSLPIAALAVEYDIDVSKFSRLLPVDKITGLISPGLFEMAVKSDLEKRKAKTTDNALVLFQIDKFNRVADAIGDDASDRLVERLAEIIHKGTRGPQDRLSRVEGAQFILMLKAVTLEQAERICARLLTELETGLTDIRAWNEPPHFSFGIAPLRTGEDLEEARAQAELALKDATRFGGHQIRCRYGSEVLFDKMVEVDR